MKGILGVDTVDRTIIDWDNLESKKLDKIMEEFKNNKDNSKNTQKNQKGAFDLMQ